MGYPQYFGFYDRRCGAFVGPCRFVPCHVSVADPFNPTVQIIKPTKVVTINANSPILESFQLLLDKNIMSAPVWDATENAYIGFLDLHDLVAYAVHMNHVHKDCRTGREVLLSEATRLQMPHPSPKPVHLGPHGRWLTTQWR